MLGGGLDNRGGLLSSASTLKVKAGDLDNRSSGRLLGRELDASVGGLLQSAGSQLYAKDVLSLDLNNGHLDNQAGLISTPGQLLLRNLASVDNRAGEISGSRAFEFAAGSLDNRGGKLLGDQLLTLRIAQALDNAAGLVSAARLDGRSGSLNNAGGKLSVGSDLVFSTAGLLDNRSGELLARDLVLDAASLENTAGSVRAERNLSLDLNNGYLNNQGGRINAPVNCCLTTSAASTTATPRSPASRRSRSSQRLSTTAAARCSASRA
nr:hypothetical protein [Pseudomonas bharatica]